MHIIKCKNVVFNFRVVFYVIHWFFRRDGIPMLFTGRVTHIDVEKIINKLSFKLDVVF